MAETFAPRKFAVVTGASMGIGYNAAAEAAERA